jgi:hypothetical protein
MMMMIMMADDYNWCCLSLAYGFPGTQSVSRSPFASAIARNARNECGQL